MYNEIILPWRRVFLENKKVTHVGDANSNAKGINT